MKIYQITCAGFASKDAYTNRSKCEKELKQLQRNDKFNECRILEVELI